MSKQQCFLTLARSWSVHNFQNFHFWGAKNFLKVFLPFRSAGFCLRGLGHGGLGSRGKTPAALGSREWPRVGRAAAHRGQGGRGCDGHERPWPRDEGFGKGKPSWGNGIFTWSGWNVDSIHGSSFRLFFFDFLLETFCQDICIPHSNSSRISGGLTLV